MKFADELLKRLFPSLNQDSPSKKSEDAGKRTVHSEMLERSEKFSARYAEWKDNPDVKLLMESVFQNYGMQKSGEEGPIKIGLHQSPYAKGVIIYYSETFSPDRFKFLFELLAEKTAGMGYRRNLSNRRFVEENDNLKEIEKHYLKPPLQRDPDKLADQLYGNILIEHYKVNEKPAYIKLLSTVYSDRNYSKPGHFDDYMRKVTTH